MAVENNTNLPEYLNSPISDGITAEERMEGLRQVYEQSNSKGASEFMDRMSNLVQNPQTGALEEKNIGADLENGADSII